MREKKFDFVIYPLDLIIRRCVIVSRIWNLSIMGNGEIRRIWTRKRLL